MGLRHLNGGIVATIMVCHCTCTAMAAAYRAENREIGYEPQINYDGGTINMSFLEPTPIAELVLLPARVKKALPRKSILACELFSGNSLCARGEFIAVRLPHYWGQDNPACHTPCYPNLFNTEARREASIAGNRNVRRGSLPLTSIQT